MDIEQKTQYLCQFRAVVQYCLHTDPLLYIMLSIAANPKKPDSIGYIIESANLDWNRLYQQTYHTLNKQAPPPEGNLQLSCACNLMLEFGFSPTTIARTIIEVVQEYLSEETPQSYM